MSFEAHSSPTRFQDQAGVTRLPVPTRCSAFAIRKPFEELALFWQFTNGEPFRAGHIDGEFEVSFDHDGDWYVSDLWVSADNGRRGVEAKGQLINLNADTDERLYLLVLDNLSGQYTTRIEEWIADELAEARAA